ncbi:MAG: helix-hairpin-helix domain-containing protein [Candidatus Xenobiia bacterium LiM19]
MPELSRSHSVAFVAIAVVIAFAAGHVLYSQQAGSQAEVMTLRDDAQYSKAGGYNDKNIKNSFRDGRKAEDESSGTVTVHVCGEVAQPGVYRLAGKNIVMHAIEAAGGATDRAEYNELNLARALKDGERIYVPQKGVRIRPSGDEKKREGDSKHRCADDEMVNINSASLNELDSLPGIGPVMAEKILSHREEQGAFRSPEELLEVPGMRQSVYEKIQSRITLK